MRFINTMIATLSGLLLYTVFMLGIMIYFKHTYTNFEKCVVISEGIRAKNENRSLDLSKVSPFVEAVCYELNPVSKEDQKYKLPYWVNGRIDL